MLHDPTAEFGDHKTGAELPPEAGFALFDGTDGEEEELAAALAFIPNADVQEIMCCNLHDITGAICRLAGLDRHVAEVWATTADDPSSGYAEFCFVWTCDPLTDKQRAKRALELLREARALIKAADNRRTLARIDAAISSARGAVRIQDYRETRAARAS